MCHENFPQSFETWHQAHVTRGAQTTGMKKLLTLSALTATLAATASAAPVISAQSIIVNPVQNNVNVRVWTNKDTSGTRTPNYFPGERIQISTSVDQDAYVYLFNVDPEGKVDLILPNRYSGGQNYLKANTTKVFPPAGAGFTFDIAAPYGLNKVLALASRTPLNIDQIAQFKTQQSGFATSSVQGQQQLAQALSIVVNPVAQPIPQNSWDSATAFYNVAQRPVAAPAPVRPAYPWTQVRTWRSYTPYTQGTNVVTVYQNYNTQLTDQGYRLVSRNQRGDNLYATYRSNSGTAQLLIRLVNGQFEVRITR
ncbi:S-layer protein [Deinococcus wulumuqiensis]|uniref:S-layer protein n=2 Tax=Deinococcus wulumuqiensis TaxID=980427 RepID=A0AAV4K412_9DEIO|nr:S-layer protein [Deinococcus wulumuqiensis]GGP29014.1 S-layer protein [Deinococcus wulumuqiensis]